MNEQVSAVAGSVVTAPEYRRPTAEPEVSNELGKDAFLKLLVAQLRYQDPLEPSTSEEFIATTAQFTVVEKLDELTKQGAATALVNSLMTASSLVGREVSATREGVPVTAVVERSTLVSGQVVLETDQGNIRLNEIVSVGAPPVASEPVGSEPVASQPVGSEPVVDDPVDGEPVATEPVVDDPVDGDPLAPELLADEPAADEPASDGDRPFDPFETSVGDAEPPTPDPTASGAATAAAETDDPEPQPPTGPEPGATDP